MRPTKDQTLMRVAWVMAQRGTCSRLQVGAVIACDTRVVSTGWNGTPAGLPHCEHDGTELHCLEAIHSERNAIGYAARRGLATDGATLYVTHAPCADCASVVIAAGIVRVVYDQPYGAGGTCRLVKAGVKVERLSV